MNTNFCPGDILNELDIIEVPDVDADSVPDADDTDDN